MPRRPRLSPALTIPIDLRTPLETTTTQTPSRNVRVLVVDDSAIVHKILSQELGRYAGIEIVGTAAERL